MKISVILLALVGTALCRVVREKRQALNCQEPDIANVCTGTAAGRIYFAHPTDNTKFLQCADGGRMFIIRCPKGEVFDAGRSSCASVQPVVTNPVDPCNAANVANNNIFFAYPSDNTKFIECKGLNQPVVLSCPTRLIYDNARQSCVLPGGSQVITGTGTTNPPSGGTVVNTGTVSGSNPCTAQAITNNNLLFPHPDPTKFIQCDLAGDAYVMQCPASLVWNQNTQNCATPYTG